MWPPQNFWVKLLLLYGVFFWRGVGGRSVGMVVVGSWGPSFKRWIACQRHGNHWRVIPTDLLKFNLFFLWNLLGIIFRLTWKKTTQTETKPSQTGLKSTPQNPPTKKQPTIPPNWSHISIPSISNHLIFCQVDSVVPMDEPLFKATPSEIRFANFASRAECRHSRWGREFSGWGGDWAVGWLVGWFVDVGLFDFVEVIKSFSLFDRAGSKKLSNADDVPIV